MQSLQSLVQCLLTNHFIAAFEIYIKRVTIKRSLNGNRIIFIDSITIDESDKIDKINTSSVCEYRILSIDRYNRYRLKSIYRQISIYRMIFRYQFLSNDYAGHRLGSVFCPSPETPLIYFFPFNAIWDVKSNFLTEEESN